MRSGLGAKLVIAYFLRAPCLILDESQWGLRARRPGGLPGSIKE